MKLIETVEAWRAIRHTLPATHSVGFVPTMGHLHPGHLSLYQRSLGDHEVTLASLFVNRTQFDQAEDFDHYPRSLDADLAQLQALGVHYCFLPEEKTLYPDHYHYRIEEIQQAQRLEGSLRPGHFTGMLTVVMKLLQIAQADELYLGEKDYQQYELIHGMVQAFFLPTRVTLCPTIREPSGLPYSSRNQRLSPSEKHLANLFASCLQQPKSLTAIRQDLLAAGIQIDYLEAQQQRLYAAVRIGPVRLLDNIPIRPEHKIAACDP